MAVLIYFNMINSGIYKIENKINHHLYIGKAKNFNNRWNQHKSNAKLGKQTHLYNAIRKYGIENFDFSIIEYIPLDKYDELSCEREKYLIKYYNAYNNKNNYNETEGGDGVSGWKPSKEWRNKIGKIMKQWYQTEEGKEKARRQSQKMKGKKINKNNKHTEEWKKQHSEKMKGSNNPNYNKHTQGKKCLCIELNKIFESTRQAEQYIGVRHQNIAAACRGDQKTSGGYHWKYID